MGTGASDMVLSVEVVAKMQALSEGLKQGKKDIKDFVDSSLPGLQELQKMLNSLGVNTSTQGLKALRTTITQLKVENDGLKNSILQSRAAQSASNATTAAGRAAVQQNTAALIQQRTATEAQKTATAASRAALLASNVANGQGRSTTVSLAGSYDEARKRLTELGREIRATGGTMTSITPAIKAQITEYNSLNDALKKIDATMGNHQRNVGNYGSGFSSAFDSIKSSALSTIGPLALMTATIEAAKAAFSHNVEISDSFVDVQRTAKLSGEEVDRLGEQLKRINTRTSLEGLLDIGFIGGRLGVAKDDLVGFITEVDKLSVVLKKEFPGGAEAVATSLGKIISVYKITQKEGITLEDALRKTGSAFLELSHNGGAPVQYLQDFTLGTAGIAQVAKLSMPTLLAYGSVLSKSGIQASTAAIAVTRFIGDLAGKREKYFAIAQLADSTLTIEKFTNLINTDAKQALDLFFKGLKTGNPPTVELNDRLKTLNLTAGRVKNTVIALAEAQDVLAKNVDIINRAYDEGASSNHNFEMANNSLAASFEKIKNGIENYFTSAESGRGLASILNAFTDTRLAGEKLSEEYVENKKRLDELEKALTPLTDRYDELQKKVTEVGGVSKLTKVDQDELKEVTAQIGSILPGVTTKFDQFGNSIAISRDRIRELTKAQRDLLIAQNREGIDKANEDFTETQRRAAAQLKIVQDLASRVGEKGPRKDITNRTVRDANDYAKVLVGQSYEAAKALVALGGTLNANQKKVVDYFEAVAKAKKPAKTDGTITGDGTNEDLQTDLGRTTDVIKAEIAALQAANKKLAINTAEFKANVKKINADKEELRLANGGKVKTVSNPYESLEKQLQEFHNKSNLVTKEGLAKDLQEWDDKYAKIKAIIAKTPAGAKRIAATVAVDTEYQTGKANIVEANSKAVEVALKKSQDAIMATQLGGEAKELDAIRVKYAELLKLAEGNKTATVQVEAEKAKEIGALIETNAAKDVNTSIKQLADIAKEYRDHKAEMFTLAISDGPAAVRQAENEKEKADLKKLYSDKLISQEQFQKQMAALVAKGNKIKLEPPVFDVKHFTKVADAAKESINTTLSNFVDSGIADAIGGSFSAMGSAIAEGGNILTAAGEGIKNSFGQLITEIGKQFIILGTAKVAAALLLTPFGAKMAAEGAGLIALGAGLSLGGGLLGAKGAGGKSEASTGTGSFAGPRFAMGVENFGGGLAMVGERGPEMVTLPTGSGVIPNHKVMESISGRGSTQVMIPDVKLKGQDIYISFKRVEKNNGRT